VTGQVQEDVVEARFAKLESGEHDLRAIDTAQRLGGRRRTLVDRQFNDRAVHVGRLGRDVGDQTERLLRVSGRGERQYQDGVAETALQLRRRPFGDDLAVVEHDELFAQAVGLFEVLRREQDRGATVRRALR
jgi:hypothetical protein